MLVPVLTYLLSKAHIIARLLMLGVITVFRIDQVMSSKEDLDYPSLKHYRHACSQRRSLDDMLTLIIHEISNRFIESSVSLDDKGVDSNQDAASQPSHTRSRKISVRMENKWLHITDLSPKRNVKKFYDTPGDSEKNMIITRRLECPGNPIFRVYYNDTKKEIDPKGKGSRSSCALCSRHTNVYCAICHVWLCGPHIDREDSTGRSVVLCLKYQEVYGYNTCWNTWHKPGLDQLYANKNNDKL